MNMREEIDMKNQMLEEYERNLNDSMPSER